MSDISPQELLLQRTRANSARNERGDPYHLALVLEGGGMRGVVLVAMASALEERGLLPAFDSVHGSSAGACGAAYFAAGQAALGTSVYYEDINNTNFINIARPLSGRSIMNKDFLIDYVMRRVKPLNAKKIVDDPKFVHIVTTNATTGEEQVFSDFRSEERLFQVLKATICIPVIAGRLVHVDGLPLVDGGVVQQISLKSAIKRGATHIIVLMTRAADELERPEGMNLLQLLLLRLLYGRKLAKVAQVRNAEINNTIEIVNSGKFDEGGRKIVIDSVVRPSGSSFVDRLTTNAEILRQGASEGRTATFTYLDHVDTHQAGALKNAVS